MSWLVKLLDILLALNNHLTVDFLIKPTISYRGRLVPQLSGHSTLLFEQREAVCSSKDSLVIFLPHCWQGSLCFAHCAVCAAILSLATISPQPSLAHAVWNFPHLFKCCSCSWNFPFHRQPLLLHLTLVSNDIVECDIDVEGNVCSDRCFTKWAFGESLNAYECREAVSTARMPTCQSDRLNHCR